MNRRATLILILFLCFINNVKLFAQASFTSFDLKQPPLKGPAVYVAAFGTTPGVSFNAEFKVFNNENRTGFLMAGFGMFNRKEYRFLAIPVGLNFVKGKGNNHSETGFAIAYNEGSQTAGTGVANKSLYAMVLAGYRYQRPTGGFFFRIYYSPTMKLKEFGDKKHFTGDMYFIPLNFGLGVGYSFASKNQV